MRPNLFMTLQESSFLLNSELKLAISMNTDLGTIFHVQAHSAHAKQVLKTTITSSCTAHALTGIKLLTRLPVEFSDLHGHRFRHNFSCSSPFCSCQTGTEDNDHFLLHCSRFSSHRRDLLDLLSRSIDFDIMRMSSKVLTTLLLHGYPNRSTITDRLIIERTLRLRFIKSTGRFKTTRTLVLKSYQPAIPPPPLFLFSLFNCKSLTV